MLQPLIPQTLTRLYSRAFLFQPVSTFLSPSLATAIFKGDKECDFTCFNNIVVSGGKVHKDIHTELRVSCTRFYITFFQRRQQDSRWTTLYVSICLTNAFLNVLCIHHMIIVFYKPFLLSHTYYFWLEYTYPLIPGVLNSDSSIIVINNNKSNKFALLIN